jgi:hypothetical protein
MGDDFIYGKQGLLAWYEEMYRQLILISIFWMMLTREMVLPIISNGTQLKAMI